MRSSTQIETNASWIEPPISFMSCSIVESTGVSAIPKSLERELTTLS
jgi:hypothetical protein